jgi:ketosteroid isomerase-like protein
VRAASAGPPRAAITRRIVAAISVEPEEWSDMGPDEPADPSQVLAWLHRAMNDHDLEGFVANFHDDYRSEQPAHPERAFGGRAQVQENWTAMFGEMPDFRADLIRAAVEGDTVWAEWLWRGTRRDRSRVEMSGVTVFGVRDGRIAWGRLYMEVVATGEGGIREAMKRVTTGARGERD